MHDLDGTDARILLALLDDPRQSVVAMAQRLGLSRNTVQARMASLERRNAFLRYDHRISPAVLGYPLTAFISVHVQQQKLDSLATELAAIPEVLEAHGLSGRADLLVRVVSTGAEDLFRINGKILACDGVERTETSLAMSELVPFRVEPLLRRALPAVGGAGVGGTGVGGPGVRGTGA
ncbi:Lrp/AsnC family transcriptional regulator [Specibacter cremeus]|uniref:Lrp/AsnC family transcriptional regulator n=1 Tax=Specibacter cremeus TaxID=1629051 RepID=UPI000F77ED14|nr:Lrp/AsnC family transcriptional regulator [Specibacter cremeus]